VIVLLLGVVAWFIRQKFSSIEKLWDRVDALDQAWNEKLSTLIERLTGIETKVELIRKNGGGKEQ